MRRGVRVPYKFYENLRIERIPPEQLYKETAFIAYYFHWNLADIISMPHKERRRWCGEISNIHKETNTESGGRAVNIEDMKFEYENTYAFINFRNRALRILNEARPAGTPEVEIISPDIIPLDIKVEVCVKSSEASGEIRKALNGFCDPLVRMRGGGIGFLPTAEEIRNVLNSLSSVTVCKNPF